MADKRFTEQLTKQDSTRHNHATKRAVGGLPQQHADLGHPAKTIDSDGNGVDIDDGDPSPS